MTDNSRPRAGVLSRIGRTLSAVEMTIGVISLLLILVLVFFQALQRYLPIDQIAWTGEVARFSLLWITFSAAGLLVTSRGHIALEILDSLKNPRAVQAVQVFALVILAIIAGMLTVEAWSLITTGIVTSPVLRIPMSVIYIPVLIGCISTAVRSVIAAIDVMRSGAVLTEIDSDGDLEVPAA